MKKQIDYAGLTRTQQIEQLTKKQDGLCAICDSQFNYKRKRVVDHCHNSGEIRGLLCYNCNLGLGMFKDDVDKLNRAIIYLSKFKPSIEEWEASGNNWWSQLPEIMDFSS